MTTHRRPAPKVEVEMGEEEEPEVAVIQVTETVEEWEWLGPAGEYRKTTVTRSWLEAAEDD